MNTTDRWFSDSKKKSILVYTPLFIEQIFIFDLTKSLVRKVQNTFADGVIDFAYCLIFLEKVKLNPKQISDQ